MRDAERGMGACRASFSPSSCLKVAGVYCGGAFGLCCCCCFQEQPGRNSPRGEKYQHGRKEAVIAVCLWPTECRGGRFANS